MVPTPSSRSAIISSACLLAVCVGLAWIQKGMDRSEQHKLRKFEPHPKLSIEEQQRRLASGQVVWWPKYESTFDEGFCSNVGTPVHGVASYTSKEICCDAWFPQQRSNNCATHDGSSGGSGSGDSNSPVDSPTDHLVDSPTDSPVNSPTDSPVDSPTDSPVNSATDSPVGSPTAFPSASPTPPSIPADCQDMSEYIDGVPQNQEWTMPYDSVWGRTPFAGKTCTELKKIAPSEDHAQTQKLCEFLSQGIYSGPVAMQACCFCGGGDHILEVHCENMEWNDMKDSGSTLNCEYLDALAEDKQAIFCHDYADASFFEDGLTVKDACCACGGGARDYNFDARERLSSGRKLQETGAAKAGAATATLLPDGKSVVDFTYRVGLGDSPGLPNLEYLGLGYDMIRGNPRGSDSSELDPGFRYRVLRLRQSQSELTVDGEYTVPLGTAVKYISSCKYDKSSVNISSESDLRTSLEKESGSEGSEQSSASIGANNLLYSFSASLSESHAFSQSALVEATTDTSKKESTETFEAKAVCSEFEASFIPGYEHELSPEFQRALDNLPVPYDKNNMRHHGRWKVFFDTFGTNYVRYLNLGGKRIYKTSMSTQDYSSLVSESVDVESTMSFEMSAGMSASVSVSAGMVKAAGNLASTFGGKKGAMIGSVVSVATEGMSDSDSLFGASVTANTATSLSNFARSKTQAENAFKIESKKTTTHEYTIGGLPSVDWREWSATVKEKPMPIKYRMGSLMEFMSYEGITAYIAACQHIYGIDILASGKRPILDGTVKHGIYTGQGAPLSQHTLDPNDQSRLLMQNDVTGFDGGGDPYDYNGSTGTFAGYCLDSQGNRYNSIMLMKAVITSDANPPTALAEAIDFCGKQSDKEQVGITFIHYTKPVRDTEFFHDHITYCHYNLEFAALPQATSGGSPSEGSGGEGAVASGNGEIKYSPAYVQSGLTCLPSKTFSTRSGVFTYSDVWKDKSLRPTAIFATPIRGSLVPDGSEDSLNPFYGSEDSYKDQVYFALTKEINSNSVLGVLNFGDSRNRFVSNSQLPDFSFLTVETFRGYANYQNNFLSGVISNNGVILNEDGKDKFSITKFGDEPKCNFRVDFADGAYGDTPTVIAFPNWLGPSEEYYPNGLDELNFSLGSIENSGFSIEYERKTPSFGFNFLVIGADMTKMYKHIKHGIIYVCSHLSYPPASTKNGIKLVGDCGGDKTNGSPAIIASDAGVLIEFDNPFTEIPSVIVTPVSRFLVTEGVRRCFVESITKTQARVKCGTIRDDDKWFPIPFSFVAVGN